MSLHEFLESSKEASMKLAFVAITAFCLLLCGCNSRAKLEAQREALKCHLESAKIERGSADAEKRGLPYGASDKSALEVEHDEEDATAHLPRAQAALEAFDDAHPEIAEEK
jgi:hypothetical protein